MWPRLARRYGHCSFAVAVLIESDDSFRLHPGSRFRRVGDEAVVVQQDAAEVLVLNEVGARILELVERRSTISEVLTILSAELDVGSVQLEQDVQQFLRELRQAKVVERVGAG